MRIASMNGSVEEVPSIFLNKDKLDVIVPLLPREIKPEGYNPAYVAVSSLNSFVWMIRAAADTSEKSLSWRNYRVGAAVLAYNFKTPHMGILVGTNIKPEQGGGINIHAEQMALAKMRQYHLDQAMAIAVWGNPTDKDANPTGAPTLRPCGRCNDAFEEFPPISPKTLILSGNANLSVCELYTAGELSEYYRQGKPGPVSEVPIFSLADDVDDKEYTAKVFIPHLLPKVQSLYPESFDFKVQSV